MPNSELYQGRYIHWKLTLVLMICLHSERERIIHVELNYCLKSRRSIEQIKKSFCHKFICIVLRVRRRKKACSSRAYRHARATSSLRQKSSVPGKGCLSRAYSHARATSSQDKILLIGTPCSSTIYIELPEHHQSSWYSFASV